MALPTESSVKVIGAIAQAGPAISDATVERRVKIRWSVLFDCLYKAYLPGKSFVIPDSCDKCAQEYARKFGEVRSRATATSQDFRGGQVSSEPKSPHAR